MHRLILAVLIAAALLCLFPVAVILSQQARSEVVLSMPTICFDGYAAKSFLEKLGEVTGRGLMSDQLIIELRTKPNGEYAVTVTSAKGRTCVFAIGSDWTPEKSKDKGI